jgi:hypothetical protein
MAVVCDPTKKLLQSRPNLDPTGWYFEQNCADGWLMGAWRSLCGNGNYGDDGEAGSFDQGDRVGVLLHLGDGSLRFFRNVVQQGTEIKLA